MRKLPPKNPGSSLHVARALRASWITTEISTTTRTNNKETTVWKLPPDIILDVIRIIIETPAVFIFDIDLGPLPHPPILPQGCQVRFRPVTSPPVPWPGIRAYSTLLEHLSRGKPRPEFPGAYESQVSKTIRSLLLTSRFTREACLSRLHGITVPTVGRHCIVRFSPAHHVICLDNIQSVPRIQVVVDSAGRKQHNQMWAKDDADLWSNLNFDVRHLAFLWHGPSRQQTIAMFGFVFPGLERMYGAVIDLPRRDPAKPLEVVFPGRQPLPSTIGAMFMHMARRYWDLTAEAIMLDEPPGTREFFTDRMRNVTLERLVLL